MSEVGTFTAYELNTIDLAAARTFYARVLGWRAETRDGHELWERNGQVVANLVSLPEPARAQGAPPHWLGHRRVEDVVEEQARFVDAGGQALGPTWQRWDGARAGRVRDAQGVVSAITDGPNAAPIDACAWHELHTTDRDAAWAQYGEPFGWRKSEAMELGPPIGTYQMFRWGTATRGAGAMSNSALAPETHPHWLFYFTVNDLERSVAAVRELGGTVYRGPMDVPGGDRVALCEDDQRAAFALHQPAE